MLIGVDVGGTKIAAGVVNGTGQILGYTRQPTDTSCAERTIESIAKAVENTLSASKVTRELIKAVGLGIPGKVNPEKGLGIASVNLSWRDVPVVRMLEDYLHIPCYIENDVKAATLGEARYGVDSSIQNMIYLNVGTGIAAGVVIGGELYYGSTGMAGEIGHAIIEPNGPLCKCGTRGCLEAVAAGPAIAARAKNAIQAGTPTIIPEIAHNLGCVVSAEAVFRAAAHGDQVALAVLDEVGKYLGLAIFGLILYYDPQLIILGGGVSKGGDFILTPIRREIERQAMWSFAAKEVLLSDKIRFTRLGQDVTILGASAVAERGIT